MYALNIGPKVGKINTQYVNPDCKQHLKNQKYWKRNIGKYSKFFGYHDNVNVFVVIHASLNECSKPLTFV